MNNQKGLTLVELLATIVISSFVVIFSTSLLINAMQTQKNINSNIVIRDEADYIMANLLKAIYTTKESEVTFVKEPDKNNYYFKKTSDSSILTGFYNNKIFINGSELNLNDSRVKIIWQEKNANGNNIVLTEIGQSENGNQDRTYHITLTLETTTNKIVRKTFKTEVKSINDVIREEEED